MSNPETKIQEALRILNVNIEVLEDELLETQIENKRLIEEKKITDEVMAYMEEYQANVLHDIIKEAKK